MKTVYNKKPLADTRELASFISSNSEAFLPAIELMQASKGMLEEFILLLGKATFEAVLRVSATAVAGEKHQGKAGDPIRRYGFQPGAVCVGGRKVRLEKPRLRERGAKEVMVPAYEALRSDEGVQARMLKALMKGVSTRNYGELLEDALESVGESKSSVSRQFVEASEKELKAIMERPLDDVRFLAITIDGIFFGGHALVGAVGVTEAGEKRVLGIAEGATENAAVAKSLLESLVERGVDPERRVLFVIDGSKALRCAIREVFGASCPVQRCRLHKLRNVIDRLPEEMKAYVSKVMRAAYKLDIDEGISRMESLAKELEKSHPGAAASLREGLAETFTVNRLGLPATLHRCLTNTNIIESLHSSSRRRTWRVTNCSSGQMALRWTAAAFLDAEKAFRKLMGYRDLWILRAALDEEKQNTEEAV